MYIKSILSIILLAVPLTFLASQVNAADCLKISSPPDLAVAQSFAAPIKKAIEDSGYCVELVNLPPNRAMQSMVKEEIDGEFPRVSVYADAMKDHVVAIPTSLASVAGVAVSLKSSGFAPKSPAELAGRKIEYTLGSKWSEVVAGKLGLKNSSKSLESLVKKMKAGRIEGFLIDSISLKFLIENGSLKADEINQMAVMDLTAYLLLHKKHAGLVDAIDKSLKTALSSQ